MDLRLRTHVLLAPGRRLVAQLGVVKDSLCDTNSLRTCKQKSTISSEKTIGESGFRATALRQFPSQS
jgi:hypothetical protein